MFNKHEFTQQGLQHGGRIAEAASRFAIAKENWLDLSTGLNPNAWPVPEIPSRVWRVLPEDEDGLQTAACQYYGCEYCLPVAGSQAAIQLLPTLRGYSKVGVLSPTYAEHAHNWQHAGHQVVKLTENDIENRLDELDVVVVINPNNPTGKTINRKTLLNWHQQLSTRGGWLIVDEAFMDVTPENSLVTDAIKPGLIILRSLGKFFGLAGVRCGFVISDKALLHHMADKLGPWSISGATRYIAKRALLDESWQCAARDDLIKSSARLYQALNQYDFFTPTGSALFQWVTHPQAEKIYKICASQGILIRYFDKQATLTPSLRFGLPANEKQWLRLIQALSTLFTSTKNTVDV